MNDVARWHHETLSCAWLKVIFLATFRLVLCMLLPRPALLKQHKSIYSKHGSLVHNEAPWYKYCRKQICDWVLFSSYKTCGHSRCWARYTTEVRRCRKIRQVVNWRANKQQDLETIESRSEALILTSVSRAKTAVNWCLVIDVTSVFRSYTSMFVASCAKDWWIKSRQ